MKILVTGSGGLIGSEVCEFFGNKKYSIIGLDNNSRKTFFGEEGDVNWKIDYLKHNIINILIIKQILKIMMKLIIFFKKKSYRHINQARLTPMINVVKPTPNIRIKVLYK